MASRHASPQSAAADRVRAVRDTCELSRRIIRCANQGLSRVEFLRQISDLFSDHSKCDELVVWLSDDKLRYRWTWRCGVEPPALDIDSRDGEYRDGARADELCRALLSGRFTRICPRFTRNGAFWTSDAQALPQTPCDAIEAELRRLCGAESRRSLAAMPFVVDEQHVGLLALAYARPRCFNARRVALYEGITQTLGLAIADRRAQARLRERVKELTCLYGIARVIEAEDLDVDQQLPRIARLLAPGWQFPEIVRGRVVVDDAAYGDDEGRPVVCAQTADIVVRGRKRGFVEVGYTCERPEFAEGPFLEEERHLIKSVSREIEHLLERADARQERERLEGQLRHADRLATIGRLSAGVAHELNEPIGAVLGFAQLAQKHPDLPGQVQTDLTHIVDAALHSREIIRKLLLFARQTPPKQVVVDLSALAVDSLSFLESRCSKQGVRLMRDLPIPGPRVFGDAVQLRQIVINLVVNAIQAMPEGGELRVGCRVDGAHATLIVADNGSGMSEDVRARIFEPFFTTKEVGEGSGLGLAVVHGIVALHHGTIDVESAPGRGAKFTVRLPVKEETHGEAPTDV